MIYLAPGRARGLWNAGLSIDITHQLAGILGYGFLSNRGLRLDHTDTLDEQEELYRFVGFHLNCQDIADPPFVNWPQRTIYLEEVFDEHQTDFKPTAQAIEQTLSAHAGQDVVVQLAPGCPQS